MALMAPFSERGRKRQRAQVSAPIELMLAVIIMTASLTLAMFVINMSQQAECTQKIKGEVEKIQGGFQDLSIAYSGTTRSIPIVLPRCKGAIEALRFAYYPEPQYCYACPGAYKGCWKIEPLVWNRDLKNYVTVGDAAVCIDMSGQTNIKLASGCSGTKYASLYENTTCPTGVGLTGVGKEGCGAPPATSSDFHFITLTTAGAEAYTINMTKSVGAKGEALINICASRVG